MTWQRSTPQKPGKMIHLSKDLVAVPRFAIGSDPKDPNRQPVGFDYQLAAGGSTYRRPVPKKRGRASNSWGAESYMLQRERQEAGARQRENHAEWVKLQQSACDAGAP